jgi:tetratricopeptide (TPR) repeat protein
MIYSPEEWSQQRDLITRLYSREGRTLNEVQSILAQQGFSATQRMFKQRFKTWNLEKNNKVHDMKVLLPITERRKSIGKDTLCHLRGRIVNAAEVRRYWARKGVTDFDYVEVEDAVSPQVRVSTPIDELSPSGPTPRLLPLPDTFRSLQIVSEQTKSYIYGTFESRWQSNLPLYTSRDNCQILQWRTWLFDAMDLFEVGKGLPAFTLLSKVCDLVANVLSEQHPSLLGEILELASTYKRPSQLPFREALVKFVAHMAHIKLGPQHALTQLVDQLVDSRLRGPLIDVCMQQALQSFQSTFGSSHEQTLVLQGSSACVLWEAAAYDKAAATYRQVAAIRDEKREKRSQLSCWADLAEAQFLCTNGEYDQAESILDEVCQKERYIESSDHVAQIMYALRAWGVIHSIRGNVGMACALQRRAVQLSQKYLEIDHVATEVVMWRYEQAENVLREMEVEEDLVLV